MGGVPMEKYFSHSLLPYLIAVVGIEPTLPLDYTANYDYLTLLFLTISSWYLIRYYIGIGHIGIEPTLYSRHNPLALTH